MRPHSQNTSIVPDPSGSATPRTRLFTSRRKACRPSVTSLETVVMQTPAATVTPACCDNPNRDAAACFEQRRVAGASVWGLARHARHAAHVHADRRQGPARAGTDGAPVGA